MSLNSEDLTANYLRRSPESSLLYKIISNHMNTFFGICDEFGDGLPNYVRHEFEQYVKCGIPAYGFLRVKCDSCNKESIVSLACKTYCTSYAQRAIICLKWVYIDNDHNHHICSSPVFQPSSICKLYVG